MKKLLLIVAATMLSFWTAQAQLTVSTAPDATICLGDSLNLNAVASGGAGTVTFSWTPTTDLTCSICANPKAFPGVTTTYTVTATDSLGNATDMINLTVINMQSTASAFRDVVCPGDTTQLMVGTIPFTCGIPAGPCLGFTDTFNLGLHNELWWTAWPGPYNGSYFDTRLQFMFRKTELNAMGIVGGVINSISFNVARKNSAVGFSYRNWNIKMGCTNLTSLAGAGWQTGLSTVVNPLNYVTSLG